MAKVIRGRAGRMQRKAEVLEAYGTTLAQMVQALVRLHADDRVLELGSPGAAQLAHHLAPRLETGELVVCVYTFDELEETRAALAGMGNVHVINDLEDLDDDEPPFDIITCIAPYHLGREAVTEQIEQAVSRLAENGTFYLAGDKQQEFDRYVETLSSLTRNVQQIAERGQYRVVSVQSRDIRKMGQVIGQRK